MTDYYISENDLQTYNDIFDNYTLEHHGILGQKHGVKNGPPYPLDAEDHSASEKKAGWRKSLNGGAVSRAIGKFTNKIKKKTDEINDQTEKRKALAKELKDQEKNAKKQAKEQEKQQKAEAAEKARIEATETPEQKAERLKAEKRAIIDSADAKTIKENASKLTTQELQEAVNRMNLMAQVDSKIPIEKKVTTFDKVSNTVDKAAKIADVATKGLDTYNKIARIYNKLSDSEIPVFDKTRAEKQKESEEKSRKELVEKAIKSGDPNKILKVKDYMNISDFKDASTTLGNLKKINEFKALQEKAKADKKEEKAAAKEEKKAAKEEKKEAKQAEKAAKQAEKEAKKAEEAAKKLDDEYNTAVKNRDFDWFQKNMGDTSTEKISSAMDRWNTEDTLNQLIEDSKKKKIKMGFG